MSKGLITVLAILGVLALVVFWGIGVRNGMATSELDVENSWGKVQSQYQRRADLIPNLVNTVKGAADFEKTTLQSVIEARANATGIRLNADQLTPENIKRFQDAQAQLSGSLSRLLAVAENYPQLKANQNFSELQAQLEGTENRITVARNDYNDAVRAFNGKIVTFPNSLIAGFSGFQKKAAFEADAAAQRAPTVQF
jgi:LemA protein